MNKSMTIQELRTEARSIWGEQKMTLEQILIHLGVVYGDLCRWERNAKKDSAKHSREELEKEFGNILFSVIRWCGDLEMNPEECIARAIASQKKFVQENFSK